MCLNLGYGLCLVTCFVWPMGCKWMWAGRGFKLDCRAGLAFFHIAIHHREEDMPLLACRSKADDRHGKQT